MGAEPWCPCRGNGDAPDHRAYGLDAKKKTLKAAEQDLVVREQWRKEVSRIPSEDLVFVDESSTNTAMTRRYARSPRGERAYGSAPRNYGKSTTLIAALTIKGLGAAMTLEGAMDTEAFIAYPRELLCPSLRPGQVVVLDNLNVHKSEKARALVEEAGCEILFLPSYSPDFSPIEPGFSKIKEGLRAVGARTQPTLDRAIADVIETVTSQDAVGWFVHCGYPTVSQN